MLDVSGISGGLIKDGLVLKVSERGAAADIRKTKAHIHELANWRKNKIKSRT